MHRRRRLTETEDSSSARRGRRKMKMGKFCDRVTHRLVCDAFRSIAPVHMGQRPTPDTRRTRGGKRLDSIAKHQYHVGIEPLEGFCETSHSATNRSGIRAAAEDPRSLHLHHGIDSNLRSHLFDGVVGRKQMGARCDHLKLELRMRIDGVDGAPKQSEVRS